jgi:hypothetical protein
MRHTALLVLAAMPVSASGQAPPPGYGFDFITIGDAGNDAYNGFDGSGRIAGRGSVGYEYRIASLETRTSQFVEFMNVLGALAPDTALIAIPSSWGAGGRHQLAPGGDLHELAPQ